MTAHDPGLVAPLLAPFKTALLATHGDDGHLRCRPMAMRQAVRGEEIWFATSPTSSKCRDLERDPRCALVFFDPADGTTVTVSGVAELIRDKKLMAELWDPSWTRWFPGGPEPKKVALLRVIPGAAERIDGRTGGVEAVYVAPRATPRRPATAAPAGRKGAARTPAAKGAVKPARKPARKSARKPARKSARRAAG